MISKIGILGAKFETIIPKIGILGAIWSLAKNWKIQGICEHIPSLGLQIWKIDFYVNNFLKKDQKWPEPKKFIPKNQFYHARQPCKRIFEVHRYVL